MPIGQERAGAWVGVGVERSAERRAQSAPADHDGAAWSVELAPPARRPTNILHSYYWPEKFLKNDLKNFILRTILLYHFSIQAKEKEFINFLP